MKNLNKYLKIVFVMSAILLLYFLLTTPKTHCQACEFEFGGKQIDGYEAFELFEEACVSYDRPERDHVYLDIDELNLSFVDS